MKFCFLIIPFLFFSKAYSQCKCASNPDLADRISCDTTHLRNHTKLYWQYNCDSSWLVFEKRNRKKEILISFEADMMDLSAKLGYGYVAEYRSTFLMVHFLISGCCQPPEFLVFDKETGLQKRNLGRLVYFGKDPKYPYAVYFDGNYDFDGRNSNFNFLNILNIDTHTIYRKALSRNRIAKTLEVSTDLFAEDLFEEESFNRNVLTLHYRYMKTAKGDWINDTITILLK